MPPRKEEVYEFGGRSDGVRLVLTRRGIEVSGHYDSIVGIEGGSISWADLDAARAKVNTVEPAGGR